MEPNRRGCVRVERKVRHRLPDLARERLANGCILKILFGFPANPFCHGALEVLLCRTRNWSSVRFEAIVLFAIEAH